jgi:hypothetical protein
MDGFDYILNWKLKRGSHTFPGQDGGTCINEAALVAAGYEYRPITSADDMPECFSRPICWFALRLNDDASDLERQQLLPFVSRLACADAPEIERQREDYISFHCRHRHTFLQRLEVLEGALAIGRQAEPLGLEDVRARMEGAKERATTTSSLPYTTVSAKLKNWFGMSKVEPTG